jgi:hypothetical protein
VAIVQSAGSPELAQRLIAAAEIRFPPHRADEELRRLVKRARQRVNFRDPAADYGKEIGELARRAIDGDLSGASADARWTAIAYAARAAASRKDGAAEAQALMAAADKVVPGRTHVIVEARILAHADTDAALKLLHDVTTPDSRSQLVTVLRSGAGPQAVVDRVRGENWTPADINAVGANNVGMMAIEANELDFASSWIKEVREAQLEECPSLLALRADLALAETLPPDERMSVIIGLPFDLRHVHPHEDAESIDKRRSAAADIAKLIGVTRDLGLTKVERLLEERLCWLEGLDPETVDAAKAKICEGLKLEPARWVRLAFRFDVPFDQEGLRGRLEKLRGAGGWSPDEGGAYLLMEMASGNAGRVARFIEENRRELEQSNFINRLSLVSMEVQALAQSGDTVSARARMEKDVPASETELRAMLATAIARCEGAGDAVALARGRFAETNGTQELRHLCEALHKADRLDELIGPAMDLARQTRTVADLVAALGVLTDAGKHADALKLLAEMPTVGRGEPTIEKRRAECQMRTGDYEGARKTLDEHFGNDIDPYVAHIWIGLEIESGQWANLQGLVERALRHKNRLGALLLIQLAQIAREVESAHVQAFVDAALAKAENDARVYLGAYVVAMGSGKERRDPKVWAWFEKAVELSGEDGPVRRKSIRELAEMAPGWRAHEERITGLANRGEVPLFIAARSLNMDLVRATLGRSIRNAEETDASGRSLILAFDGSREEKDILKDVHVVAADVSSLLTLGFLQVADALVRGFTKVVIAPGTLALLFKERQHVRFHQPSLVERAKHLRRLLDEEKIKVAPTPSTLPAELVAEVGQDLAGVLAAAQVDGGVVVQPGPLHKAGSLMESVADLGAFAQYVSDTRQVLAYTKAEGLLKSEVAEEATRYITAADAGMPGAVAIEAGRNVYLGEVAVSYLEYTGVLAPFCRKHGQVLITPALEREINALIAHEQHAERVLECIEDVRDALARGLADGTVVVADVEGGGDEDENGDAPTVRLLSTSTPVEALIVDDKFMNRRGKWTARFGEAKVATTLDVLEELARRKEIVPQRLYQLRRDLREAGYALVGTDEDELLALIGAAEVTGGKLVETSELRILRENVLLVMARKLLLPREEPWVGGWVKAGMLAVRRIWIEGQKDAEAKANWIMGAMPDHWQFYPTPVQPDVWPKVRSAMAWRLAFLFNAMLIPRERRVAYSTWVEKRILLPLESTDPELLAEAVARFKDVLKGAVDGSTISRSDGEEYCGQIVASAPEPVRQAAMADGEFARHVGLKITRTLRSDGGYTFDLNEFARMLREVVGGAEEVRFEAAGEAVEAKGSVDGDGTARIVTPKGTLIQPLAALLGDDREKRLAAVDGWCRGVMLPAAEATKWREIAAQRPFTADEFWDLCAAEDETPEALLDRLQRLQTYDVPTLVPALDLYWECLLPAPARDYPAWRDTAVLTRNMEQFACAPRWKLTRVGFNGACQAPLPAAFIRSIDTDSLDALCSQEDPFSLVLALEITSARLDIDKNAVERGKNVLRRLLGDSGEGERRNRLFLAATIVAYTGLQRSARWRSSPLYWRRMAVLAHAGALTNVLIHAYPDPQEFESWALRQGGATFYVGTIRDRREGPRWTAGNMSKAALQAMVLARAVAAVGSLPADKQPAEWTSLTGAAMHAMKEGGDLPLAYLPGPLSDFEGFVPPFDRKDFKETLEDLERCAAPSQTRGFSLFLAGVALEGDDLRKVEYYIKALDIAAVDEQRGCVAALSIAAGAAAAYRHAGLADAIAEKGCALFPKVNSYRKREALGAILDASNAKETVGAGWLWAAKAFQGLAYGATSRQELAALSHMIGTLGGVAPESEPYFASVRAVVQLRRPHLPVDVQ